MTIWRIAIHTSFIGEEDLDDSLYSLWHKCHGAHGITMVVDGSGGVVTCLRWRRV